MTSITQNSGLNREYSGQHISANDPVKYTSEHSPYQNGAEIYSEDSQHQASSANNTDGGFLAGATETLANAGETAKQYLPTGVVNALQNVGVMGHDTSVTSTTLPSQETKFAGSRGGVGTLPGTRSETEVAKLPDERKYEEEVGRPLGREGVMGTQAEERQTIGLADPFLLEQSRRVNPTASMNTAAKFINLDAIPTPDPETPLETGREHTLHNIPDKRSPEHKTEPMPLNNGPTGMEPQQEMDKSVNKPLPAPGGNANVPATSDFDKEKNGTSYSKDQAKKQAPKTEPPPADRKVHDEQKNSTEDLHITDKNEKPSLAQKIKGEVKVISGKLSNNPSKIEAGQALKKGTA